MIVNYFALIIAIALSIVSGYYSILGLTAIFSGSFWAVVFMGTALEAGKLITASWLYNNWNVASKLLKIYLTTAVVILMLITSMGVFGFLSKAHIEQTIALNSGTADELRILQTDIANHETKIKDINTQLSTIDTAVTKLTERGQANASLKASVQQRKYREELISKRNSYNAELVEMNKKRILLESQRRKIEAEVGPLKYITELFYGNSDNDQLEKAVKWVIIMLIFVFDPLAVLLLLAANTGIVNQRRNINPNTGKIEIHKENIINGENICR